MTRPAPSRYRTTTWRACNAALKQRGSLLIWFDPEMEGVAAPRGRRGRPATFSDAAVPTCLMLEALFGLPLRQIEPWGAMGSSPLARGAGGEPAEAGEAGLAGARLRATLCRRQKDLTVTIPYRPRTGAARTF